MKKTIRYGWYSRANQPIDEPDFDPSHDANCPFCEKPITPQDVRTHSLMATAELDKSEGKGRSYFFRTHKTCDEQKTKEQDEAMMHKMMEEIQL